MRTITGFIDLQVNGFGGVDFSSPSLTEEALALAFRALVSRGTVAFLPTVITSPLDVYRRNLPLIARVGRSDEFRGHVLGIHLEGPFISAEPGAVGAHDPRYVIAPDVALFLRLLDWADGTVKMLTLAAEIPGAESVAAAAVSAGLTVSIGHSLFDTTDLKRMSSAGACALTHLGNGLPNLLPRHPNPIWDGLADDAFTAMVISDGHHLPASTLKTIARAKEAERLVVVSDASPVAGLPPGEYQVMGNQAVLEPSGRLHNPEKQCLVGSSATMLECMNFLASLGVFTPAELLAVGYHNPLRLIGCAANEIGAGPGPMTFESGAFRL